MPTTSSSRATRTSTPPRSPRCPTRARSMSRIAAGPARADARDHPVGYAGVFWRGEEPAARGLRHVGTLHRSGREHRHPQGPAGAARNVDRRARRHRGIAAAHRPPTVASAWPNPSSPACASTCTASRGAPSQAPTSRRCTTHDAASSRRKWSSSRSAKTSCAKKRCGHCRSSSRASIRARVSARRFPP